MNIIASDVMHVVIPFICRCTQKGIYGAFALSVLAIKQVSNVSWLKSVLTALTSIAVTICFIIVFIR